MLNFRLNNCFVHLKFMHVLHIYIHLTLFSTLIFSIGKGLQLLPEGGEEGLCADAKSDCDIAFDFRVEWSMN